MPGGQIIQHHDVMAHLDQARGADATDITRTPGDKQPHPVRLRHRRRPRTACASAPATSTVDPRPESITVWLARAWAATCTTLPGTASTLWRSAISVGSSCT